MAAHLRLAVGALGSSIRATECGAPEQGAVESDPSASRAAESNVVESRIAVATSSGCGGASAAQDSVAGQEIIWALLDALEREGLRIQTFRSRACFDRVEGDSSITGLVPRDLDSWLMRPALCQGLFRHAYDKCDLALVRGSFTSGDAGAAAPRPRGGQLEDLCQWLGLPRIGILDAPSLDRCRLPDLHEELAGVLLDRVGSREELWYWQTTIEGLWGVPVVGALELLPCLRAPLRQIPIGGKPDRKLQRALGDNFLRWARLDRILNLADQREIEQGVEWPPLRRRPKGRLRVAVAFDDAFSCYYPDTLEMLELCGAEVRDFSPLKDDRLPERSDIVYFGCGHPERYIESLAHNHCFAASLKRHVQSGGRLYAEGGGLAYLCQHIVCPDGASAPMAGVFPAVARLDANAMAGAPLEVTLSAGTWLAPAGTALRGYTNPWQFEPLGHWQRCGTANGAVQIFAHQHAIGSRMHLNFAAQPEVLDRFFGPHDPRASVAASAPR